MSEAGAVKTSTQSQLADKIAAVDALAVATRILAHGPRSAMQASTIEIMAVARRVMTLTNLADLTFDMLATSDRLTPALTPAARKQLIRELDRKIDLVGVSLEALGYVPGTPPPTSKEENDDGAQD